MLCMELAGAAIPRMAAYRRQEWVAEWPGKERGEDGGQAVPFLSRIRNDSRSRSRLLKRRAGLQTWTRALGSDGLPAEAEARIMEIEDELRRAEARIRREPQL
jgi:hypothetical protein